MKSDVKAVRVTASTGAVFAGRTRLRGIILASDQVVLQDSINYFTIQTVQ